MTVKLIQITPNPEEQIAYIARVSNPNNQDNPDYAKLLGYCIKHQHWSIFEQAFMTLEIETTRGLAAQILRHRSFTFQEFSQRYADTSLVTKGNIPLPELRRQDKKNRQNSTNDLDPDKVKMLEKEIRQHFTDAQDLYRYMIDMGVAKECARFVLPLAVPTRLYMSGSVRSWIHYIDLRSAHGTQKEHKDIAEQCRDIFKVQLPTVSEALGWV
jgi:thymidylate synthase (FAD)|tara:strand:- start:911 stop:1549 length:639 start_codon:yes stop_codon:yes gene_type:complete